MDILSQLTRAIELRKPISFEYDVPNKIKGLRFGHPHAIFLHPTTDNMMIHIFQIDGVSDSKDKLPGWRQPLIEHISKITIFEDYECFEIAIDYKPNSPMYARLICKV
jgi:hypothetical protein